MWFDDVIFKLAKLKYGISTTKGQSINSTILYQKLQNTAQFPPSILEPSRLPCYQNHPITSPGKIMVVVSLLHAIWVCN